MLDRVRRLLWRAVRMEVGVWRSVWRFVTRRGIAPPGADRFGYDKPLRPILIAFIAVSAIEIPIVDLLVHPWPWIRIPLLVLGIWGATWMLGLLFGYLTCPHTVGPEGIRLRHGDEFEIVLPWGDVASVASRAHGRGDGKTFQFHDGVLAITIQDGTSLELETEHPVEVRLPNGRRHEVRVIRFDVDDRAAFLVSVRRHLRDWEAAQAATPSSAS